VILPNASEFDISGSLLQLFGLFKDLFILPMEPWALLDAETGRSL
jgi:hypothetical protein